MATGQSIGRFKLTGWRQVKKEPGFPLMRAHHTYTRIVQPARSKQLEKAALTVVQTRMEHIPTLPGSLSFQGYTTQLRGISVCVR